MIGTPLSVTDEQLRALGVRRGKTRRILIALASGERSQKDVAHEFGVDQPTVCESLKAAEERTGLKWPRWSRPDEGITDLKRRAVAVALENGSLTAAIRYDVSTATINRWVRMCAKENGWAPVRRKENRAPESMDDYIDTSGDFCPVCGLRGEHVCVSREETSLALNRQ